MRRLLLTLAPLRAGAALVALALVLLVLVPAPALAGVLAVLAMGLVVLRVRSDRRSHPA